MSLEPMFHANGNPSATNESSECSSGQPVIVMNALDDNGQG